MKGDAAAHNRAWAAARARLADETGSRVLDWGGRLPLVLVYPNSYHVGMSNLGLHALYQLWGEMRDVVCERVFYEPGLPPLSLENFSKDAVPGSWQLLEKV